MSSIICF